MQPQQSSQEKGLLGRLCSGDKKLEGKTFYLDNVKKRSTTLLLEAISLLGGRFESFLHKDVNFVVTGSHESLEEEKSVFTKSEEKGAKEGSQTLMAKPDGGLSKDKRRQATPRLVACGSRGKALLEKAISNKERQQKSSVLSNARSWGVKILHVDDVLLYLKHLTRESFSAKHRRPEKSSTKQSLPVVKATSLRTPYLKIEDVNRKYKPLHMQSLAFPSLYFLGRFSPFESPPPPLFKQPSGQEHNKKREKKAEKSLQGKSQTPVSCNPSPWRLRKKDSSYCECCCETFTNLEEHLQSDQHRSFVLDPSNYKAVDQLVAEMLPCFDSNPPQESEERSPTPLPVIDDCELELCSDVEVEYTVQVLKRDDSPFSGHIPNPSCGQPLCNPASPSKGLKRTSQDISFQLTDNQPVVTEAQQQSHQVQPRVSSPTMPVLTIEPLDQQLEPDAPCLLPDPYSLPPVLSPQVPFPRCVMDPYGTYSEPPILSPQKYYSEDNRAEQICEMNTEKGGLEPLLPTLLPVFFAGSSLQGKLDLNSLCNTDLKSPPRSSITSNSYPGLTAVAPNPKKRCRSASPEQSSKRRKSPEEKSGCCRQRLSPLKQQRDNLAKVVACSLYSHASYPVRQTFPQMDPEQMDRTGSFSAAQKLTQTLFQIDSSAGHPPLKGTDSKSPLDNNKTTCAISSRHSQPSPSLSTSMWIEPALIPDIATHSSGSTDSDWDCDLQSPPTTTEQNRELDRELLHRPCPWMRNSSYESHLHTVLQPSSPATSLFRKDADSPTFSRTVVQIVEVQH
ncbi:uncharacterized protein dbf4b isoform X2 [Cyprinodon tularosa]|nr:uncharacterized protein dbf4b isoform X2 [Cyprinodon tularosa]